MASLWQGTLSDSNQRQALFRGVAATVLMLVYLQFGSREFFLNHLSERFGFYSQAMFWAALYQFAAAWLLFFLVPLIVLLTVGCETIASLGLGKGDTRAGLWVAILGLLLVSLPGGWLAGNLEQFRTEYPLAREAVASVWKFFGYELAYGALYYLAWEFFFRGVLQIGMSRYLGVIGALLFQTAGSTLLHIGKPWAEVWAALAAGIVFGLVAARLRTVWPLVIIHWGLGAATDFFCARALGYFG